MNKPCEGCTPNCYNYQIGDCKNYSKMKNIREMTDEQVIEIAKLGASEFLNIDWIQNLGSSGINNQADLKIEIIREVFDTSTDGKEYLVIRAKFDGFGDTYIQIWEGDNEDDPIEIDLVVDKQDYRLDNIVSIVKRLIKWEFV